jgi:hypothetical protein
VTSGTLMLQDREVDFVRYTDRGTFENPSAPGDGAREWLLGALGMEQHNIADIMDSDQSAAVVRIRFSGEADQGGTMLMVRTLGTKPMDEPALEDLFQDFDLWARVGSAPVFVPLPEDLETPPK